MNLNFKNILAGVGGMYLLFIIVIIGIFSNANYNSDIPTDSSLEIYSNDDYQVLELADNSKACGLLYTYDGYNGKKFSLDTDDLKHLAFDEHDNMYVPETGKIIVFDKNGNFKKILYFDGDFIWDLVAFENRLYFLQNFDIPTGQKVFLEKYEIEPKFKFIKQTDIEADVYMTLNKNARYVYTSTWLADFFKKTKIDDLTSLGIIDNLNINVHDVFFDNTNNLLYVLDGKDNSVKVYDKNDQFLYSFGRDGGSGISLEGTISIVVDSSGNNLYVAESSGKVKKFTKDSNGQMKYAGVIEVFKENEKNENEIKSVELDSQGNLYIIHSHFTISGTDDYVVIKKYSPPCAKITIKKEIEQKTNTLFDFTTDFYQTNTPAFTLKANTETSYNTFKLANSITEILPKGFRLVEVRCFDATGQEYGKLSGQTLNFELDTFKNLTCTFKNICDSRDFLACGENLEPQKSLISP